MGTWGEAIPREMALGNGEKVITKVKTLIWLLLIIHQLSVFTARSIRAPVLHRAPWRDWTDLVFLIFFIFFFRLSRTHRHRILTLRIHLQIRVLPTCNFAWFRPVSIRFKRAQSRPVFRPWVYDSDGYMSMLCSLSMYDTQMIAWVTF